MPPNNNSDFKKPEQENESLEALKKNLYSRQEFVPDEEKNRGRFRMHDVDVPKNWGNEIVKEERRTLRDPELRMSFLRKVFLVSIVFFIISACLAVYVFFGGGNVVSSNNVAISITGPVAVSGGEIVPLEISITNQNNADLETTDLIIDYPDGTREPVDQGQLLKRYREAVGVIRKGETVSKKVQAVFFGEAGQAKIVGVSVEYRLKGSNAIFSKMKEYDVSISSSPVTLTVTSVNEVNANQNAEFSVDVVSNSSTVIKQLALSAEYPFGFTFTGSDPSPAWSNSLWQLGDVKPGVKRTIKIRGTIAGQDNEDKTFRFAVGTEDPKNENAIGTNFLSSTRKITIKKPFIGNTLLLDGDNSATHIVKSGKSVRADLTLSNNVGLKITDVKVSVKLSGNIFDTGSVAAGRGFYRSSEQTILWDQTLKSDLAVLNPDSSLGISFSFGTLPESQIRSLENPEMKVEITVSGRRLNESGVAQEVSSTITKSLRTASSLGLTTRAVYSAGQFTNTGPIPPKVDNETSYTIVWSLTNGSTDLSNTKVTAILPSYMKWLDSYGPQSERISYNPVGGQITWDVGDLSAGTGFANSPREVSFQVSLNPSTTQVGTAPTLLSEASASGDDTFAGVIVQTASRSPLTTDLTTDISFRPGQGNVVK